jgi:hypothetical protein
MDEIHNQLTFINFTALTKRIAELQDTRRVAQLTQADEFEEDGELERLIDLRDQLVRIFGAEGAVDHPHRGRVDAAPRDRITPPHVTAWGSYWQWWRIKFAEETSARIAAEHDPAAEVPFA